MFSYSTEKEVIIKSYSLRIIKLVLQLIVSAYLVFVIVYENGYQKESIGFGFTQARVFGSAYAKPDNSSNVVVWDVLNVGNKN
jgi:hypothetical protein